MADRFFRPCEFKCYHVTGVMYRTNRRFKDVYFNIYQAFSINLWNGSVWGVRHDGKRVLLKRVTN